jgi:hypothetical protein
MSGAIPAPDNSPGAGNLVQPWGVYERDRLCTAPGAPKQAQRGPFAMIYVTGNKESVLCITYYKMLHCAQFVTSMG